jgi:hypothetical protein
MAKEDAMIRRSLRWILVGSLSLIVVAQILPFGGEQTNPPVQAEPQWDSPFTRSLAVGSCYDCHSNETAWPWYAKIAPASWIVSRHVNEGRSELNFSEWHRRQKEAREAVKAVRNGSMPPWYYPAPALSAPEREALIQGLEATLKIRQGSREQNAENAEPHHERN